MSGGREFEKSYGYYVCISEFNKFIKQFDISDPDIIRAIRHRCYIMQNNGAKAAKDMPLDKIDEKLAAYPMEVQIEYAMLIRRLVDFKQFYTEKLDTQKSSYLKKIDKLKKSPDYRVGTVVNYIPKRIYHFFENIKRKGLAGTVYGIKRKITGEQRELEPQITCVSIIIPMFNAEKYLRETLDRILRQTLKSIEIICVNDGSTDNTLMLLEEYAAKDNRVKVVNQENQGAGIARNNGMKHAKGEYYLFLDADDIFDEKLCEEAYYKGKYDMADVVLFEAYRLNVQTHEKEEMNWVLREQHLPHYMPFSPKEVRKKLYQLTTACPWSKMFKASFVKKTGLQFQNTKNANDVFFTRCALALAKRITVVKKRLVTYRFNDGSNTQSRKNKAPVEFYKAFKAVKEELIKRNKYSMVEQSYVNMVLSESLFNLRTAGDDKAKDTVKNLLLNEGFAFYELEKYDESYFYNKKEYAEYRKLIKADDSKDDVK